MRSLFDDDDDDDDDHFHQQASTTADGWDQSHGQDSRLAYQARLAQWILLITTGAGGMPSFSAVGDPQFSRQATVTGVEELANPLCSAAEVSAALQKAANALPPHPMPVSPCSLRAVVDWLSVGAGLNDLERDVLELALAVSHFSALSRAAGIWGNMDYGTLVQALSVLLYRAPKEIAAVLLPSSRLQRSALVGLSGHTSSLKNILYVPNNISLHLALIDHPSQILEQVITPVQDAKCQLADFAYMAKSTELAKRWLMAALNNAKQHGKAGHLLVCGAPGLGKTEWVRALLHAVRLLLEEAPQEQAQNQDPTTRLGDAFELAVLDEDGSPLSGIDRLTNLRLVLQLKRNSTNTVLVFDEADDVFSGTGAGDASIDDDLSLNGLRRHQDAGDNQAVSMRNHRASLNRLIEDSPLPVIWIMNHPEILDPAVLRRFDAVIRFESMPRSIREGLLKSAQVADAPTAQAWSELRELSPALIERLSHLQQSAQAAGCPMDTDLTHHWLRQRLNGRHSQKLLGRTPPASTPSLWQADQVNANVDLLALSEGISRSGQARILLHGAPGTGKTAFAHALAKLVDRPLVTKRASDLLSAYVGETEQRIRGAFEQAAFEEAVLFIDEVDSLLAQRSQAVRTWEVSQINELLQHLGEFEGVVVMATNRLDALDPAVIRRTDARVEFKTLSSEQSRLSLNRLCAQLQVPCSKEAELTISQFAGLTPGDFSQIARRWAFSPRSEACEPDAPHKAADLLVQWLRQETSFRDRGEPTMGFLSKQQPLVN